MVASVVLAGLLAVVFATAGSSAPGPAPTAAASAAPLKEIGRIRVTSPFCKALVAGAIRAVDIETQNDTRLTIVENFLERVDLDGNQILKHRGVTELAQQFVTLRAAAVEGNGIMRAFREQAKAATKDEQRANLTAFADALDGVLHRQKVLADDLGRLIAYLDSHEPIDKDRHDSQVFDALLTQDDARYPHTRFDVRDFGPTAGLPDPLSVTAKAASAELIQRSTTIGGDEGAAAAKIEPAFASC